LQGRAKFNFRFYCHAGHDFLLFRAIVPALFASAAALSVRIPNTSNSLIPSLLVFNAAHVSPAWAKKGVGHPDRAPWSQSLRCDTRPSDHKGIADQEAPLPGLEEHET
jgi:hypothetical protein